MGDTPPPQGDGVFKCGDKRLWLLMPYFVLMYYLRGGKPLSKEQAMRGINF